MKRPISIILWTFASTLFVVILYTVYLFKTNPESSTLGIPFGFIVLSGLALFV